MKRFSNKQLHKGEYMVIASMALFVAMIAGASMFTGLDGVWRQIRTPDLVLIGGLLGLSLVNYTLRGMRWHLFSHKLGMMIPPSRLALYYSAGFSMVTTPGKIGTALRLWFLKRCHNFQYSRTTPLMFMDQLTDSLAMLLLAIIGSAAFSGHGPALVFFAAVLVGIVILFRYPKLCLRLLNMLYALSGKRKPKFFVFLRKVLRNTTRLFSPGLFSATVGLSLVGWGAEVIAFSWLLSSLGAEISFYEAMFIFSFSTVIGAISMLPGGLGSAEATMFGLLLLAGVPAESAVAATAIIRLTTLWFAVGIGFGVLPFALKLAK